MKLIYILALMVTSATSQAGETKCILDTESNTGRDAAPIRLVKTTAEGFSYEAQAGGHYLTAFIPIDRSFLKYKVEHFDGGSGSGETRGGIFHIERLHGVGGESRKPSTGEFHKYSVVCPVDGF